MLKIFYAKGGLAISDFEIKKELKRISELDYVNNDVEIEYSTSSIVNILQEIAKEHKSKIFEFFTKVIDREIEGCSKNYLTEFCVMSYDDCSSPYQDCRYCQHAIYATPVVRYVNINNWYEDANLVDIVCRSCDEDFRVDGLYDQYDVVFHNGRFGKELKELVNMFDKQ